MKAMFAFAIAALSILGAGAQGTVIFNNNVPGVVVTHIYYETASGDPGYRPTFGNGPNDFPVGPQTYPNSRGLFSGYGQLFASDRADADETLLWEASPVFTVENGKILNPGVVSLKNIPADSAVVMLQLRVWADYSPFATNWWTAVGSSVPTGWSPAFKVSNIGGQVNSAPYLEGLQSFAVPLIGGTVTPEPSTIALLVIGGVGILLYQKRTQK